MSDTRSHIQRATLKNTDHATSMESRGHYLQATQRAIGARVHNLLYNGTVVALKRASIATAAVSAALRDVGKP